MPASEKPAALVVSQRAAKVVQVALGDQNYVEVASQVAMLEAVIEQVHLRAELVFGKLPGGVTIFADNNRHS